MMTVSVNASEETKLSCEAWFQEMDRNPLEFLLSISKNPIMEPRLAVLRIYLGMADQSWGQKVGSLSMQACSIIIIQKKIDHVNLLQQLLGVVD